MVTMPPALGGGGVYRISLRRFCSLILPPRQNHPRTDADLRNQILLLATRGQLQEALSLLTALNKPIDGQTYATLFQACARHGCLRQGMAFHQLLLSQNPSVDLFVTNHLINMYCKCGRLSQARELFDEMPLRNYVSWTALISGYAQQGLAEECFLLFSDMLAFHRPNEFAFASVLSSCRDFDGGDERGRQVHALALKMSLDASVFVGNALIAMYSRKQSWGSSKFSLSKDEAWTFFRTMPFRNLITWNSMVAGFQLRGLGRLALDLFTQMHLTGIGFDRATLLSVLSSLSGETSRSTSIGLKCCYQIHCASVKTGFFSEIEVTSALVKTYSDLGGDIADCYKIFSGIPNSQRDIILWTGIITAFADREPEQSLFLFRDLLRESISPDWYTFSSVLKACAGLITEKHASSVHSLVIQHGFDNDTVLANSLIHAYARSSCIEFSNQVFRGMKSRDVVSWNSMLKAHALHGQGNEALQLFKLMDVQPDSATFVALLSACSHSGLVEDGIRIFEMMELDYSLVPQLDHYACMVDILGRAGRVFDAWKLITKMPMEPDAVIWSTLLGSCTKHRDPQLAKTAANKLNELKPETSLGYVQISNICCLGGRFHEAGLIWKEMESSRVSKEPGLSWVELGNQIHEFASGGTRHPQKALIFARLQGLIGQLKERGYAPLTSLALHDIEEEHKEEQLYYHSEKLALVFALMNEPKKKDIKIVKNIRICVDCHNFMKLASGFLNKDIVVRDSNRFHHFKGNACSCHDYW